MIRLSNKIDLGLDATRIKDPRDARRQTTTAETLLRRFSADVPDQGWPLQLLADEVGMGKTFVSLAVAFSVLEHLESGRDAEFEGCYQKVVVLAPQNKALLGKWTREVGEFVGRCILPQYREEAQRAFRARHCERLDDFAKAARSPGKYSPRVLIASMEVFQSQRLANLELKQRFTMAALFRYWGNSFQKERRARLLQHAHEVWPRNPDELGLFTDAEWDELPCDSDAALEAIARIDRSERREHGESSLDELLALCREVTSDYQRGRLEAMQKLKQRLTEVYREILSAHANQSFPLVVVDEAHNWKNGPGRGARGYDGFRARLASRTRRLLLLTATPFQLRPQEMLELMRIGKDAEVAKDRKTRAARLETYTHHLEQVVEPTLGEVDHCSRRFAKSWARLAPSHALNLAQQWAATPLSECRRTLARLADANGKLKRDTVYRHIDAALESAPPHLRAVLRDALALFAFNRELTTELGRVVVRHRRHIEHRLFKVGEEFPRDPKSLPVRPDRHVMHAAPGLDVRGKAELPHYLLMRCVADMRGEGRRTSLGSALTGCYSTLFDSSEGKHLEGSAKKDPASARRYALLRRLVGKATDPQHPKVAAVVDAVVRAWEHGEKSLVFCFRTNTARRLHEILHQRIEQKLVERQTACLGSDAAFASLRSRLLRREDGLITILLDRPLHSLALAWPESFASAELHLLDDDLPALAEVLACHRFEHGDKADRVLVQRATDHVLARRLRDGVKGEARAALDAMADASWVERPYGLSKEQLRVGEAQLAYLRGTDHVFPRRPAQPGEVRAVLAMLRARRAREESSIPVFDAPDRGPSLWFGGAPVDVPAELKDRVQRLHRHLASLTVREEALDWNGRRKVFEALRRIATRDAVLIRLLPERSEREEHDWASLLVRNFWHLRPGDPLETMAHRIDVFLEGLTGESGSFDELESARAVSLDATRVGHDRYVALVSGDVHEGRERIFNGFNSPLFPDVLVCTSVGAEGIDLHRFCRHVIHYDLAWNPAVIEQRTGRVDRIGSQTFRERSLEGDTMLEIGVPYLAGTYDERMFEELRLRAQVFEVMTGGDLALDEATGSDQEERAEGEDRPRTFAVLPPEMVEDLRVRLDVWREP